MTGLLLAIAIVWTTVAFCLIAITARAVLLDAAEHLDRDDLP